MFANAFKVLKSGGYFAFTVDRRKEDDDDEEGQARPGDLGDKSEVGGSVELMS